MPNNIIKAAVIGYPIKHSLSPIIHNHWINENGVNGSYDKIDIPPENLEEGIKRLIDDGYSGFNLTMPHKELALNFVDEIDELASNIGAINTIKIGQNGKTFGTNTDCFGSIQNLKSNFPNWDIDKPVMVIGAGGAAKAVIMGLINAGVLDIRVYNRTIERAEGLALHFLNIVDLKISVISEDNLEDSMTDIGLFINTTSLGMAGHPKFNIDISNLPKTAIVYDIVYNPLNTMLLQNAKGLGLQRLTGIGMLIYQAIPGFKLWFGFDAKHSNVLENKLLESLNRK